MSAKRIGSFCSQSAHGIYKYQRVINGNKSNTLAGDILLWVVFRRQVVGDALVAIDTGQPILFGLFVMLGATRLLLFIVHGWGFVALAAGARVMVRHTLPAIFIRQASNFSGVSMMPSRCWIPHDYIGSKIESLLRAREVMELLVSTSAPEEAQ